MFVFSGKIKIKYTYTKNVFKPVSGWEFTKLLKANS